MPTTTFSATLPDGTVVTRKSATKAYTHCLAIQWSDGRWVADSWASRLELAQKQAARFHPSRTVQIVEAVVTHVTKPRKAAAT